MLSNQKCFLIMCDRHCKLFVLSLCFLYTQSFKNIVISTSRQTNIIINGFVGRIQQRGNNCFFCQSSIKKEPYTYRALVPAASGLAWIVASQSSFLCYQSLKLLPIPIWSTGHDLLPFNVSTLECHLLWLCRIPVSSKIHTCSHLALPSSNLYVQLLGTV